MGRMQTETLIEKGCCGKCLKRHNSVSVIVDVSLVCFFNTCDRDFTGRRL